MLSNFFLLVLRTGLGLTLAVEIWRALDVAGSVETMSIKALCIFATIERELKPPDVQRRVKEKIHESDSGMFTQLQQGGQEMWHHGVLNAFLYFLP
jgi:hypothetical protein